MASLIDRRKMMMNISGSGKILPDEYQQVEWIQSQINCAIDTGVIATGLVDLYMDIEFLGGNHTYPAAFSAWSGSGNRTRILYMNTNFTSVIVATVNNGGGPSENTINNLQTSGRHQYLLNSYGLYLDGTQVWVDPYNNTSWVNQVSNTYTLFYMLSGGRYLYGKCYSSKIYNNGSLIRNFIPCYRKVDNEPGMYDIKNNVFYTNISSGTFIVGPDIN